MPQRNHIRTRGPVCAPVPAPHMTPLSVLVTHFSRAAFLQASSGTGILSRTIRILCLAPPFSQLGPKGSQKHPPPFLSPINFLGDYGHSPSRPRLATTLPPASPLGQKFASGSLQAKTKTNTSILCPSYSGKSAPPRALQSKTCFCIICPRRCTFLTSALSRGCWKVVGAEIETSPKKLRLIPTLVEIRDSLFCATSTQTKPKGNRRSRQHFAVQLYSYGRNSFRGINGRWPCKTFTRLAAPTGTLFDMEAYSLSAGDNPCNSKAARGEESFLSPLCSL